MQEASIVVLAAWSAQNPRLMLNSATDKHPNGLANASGFLGKYLTAHFSSGTSAMFDEDLQPYMGTIAAQYFSYDLYDKNAHKDKGAFGSTFMVAGSAQRYSALGGVANSRVDLFGADLAAFMKRAARGYTRIGAFGEEMPVIENRVELASDKDEFGMPLGKITHSFNDDAVALVQRQFRQGFGNRQGDRRQGGLVEQGRDADHPSHGRHHHGPQRQQLGDRQLRRHPRDPQSLDRRPRHLPNQRRAEPDLHHLRAVAARGGEFGEELGDVRGVIVFRPRDSGEGDHWSSRSERTVVEGARDSEFRCQSRQ